MTTTKPNGYILHETDDIVVIATGFARKSDNPKTGDMIQVWILPRDMNPVRSDQDRRRCRCMLRLQTSRDKRQRTHVLRPSGERSTRSLESLRRGMYPYLPVEDYARMFERRKVDARFDSAHMVNRCWFRFDKMAEITRVSDGWTGYTHQWNTRLCAL